MARSTGLLALALAVGIGGLAQAADAVRGEVTNLPLPRYVSVKSAEVNVRRGPSLGHRIDWVYNRKGLPLRVTAEYGHWRRVEDRDGQGGWIHYALLSGTRTALVEADEVPLRLSPDPDAPVMAVARRGVVARIEACEADWCRLRKDGHRGWARKAALWGVGADEIID